jgi:hypothetical protein
MMPCSLHAFVNASPLAHGVAARLTAARTLETAWLSATTTARSLGVILQQQEINFEVILNAE